MINFKVICGEPCVLQEQPDCESKPLKFLYSHGVEHFNKKIYGVPFDSRFLLEIEPLKKKPKIRLIKMYFPERWYSSDNSTKSAVDTKNFPAERGLFSLGYSNDKDPLDLAVLGGGYILPSGKPRKGNIQDKISMIFPVFDRSSRGLFKWSRGIVDESSRTLFFLSLGQHKHLGIKIVGNEFMFFPCGFNPNRVPGFEKKTAGGIDSDSFDVNPALTVNSALPLSAAFVDTTFTPSPIYFRLTRYDRLQAKAFQLDYILANRDKRIYGLSWIPRLEGGGEDTGGKIRNSTQLNTKPLRYSVSAYGSFEEIEKFSKSVEYNGAYYCVPRDSASVLKMYVDEISNQSPRLSRIGQLDYDVLDLVHKKYENYIKTSSSLFFIPYNASRFLTLSGSDSLRTSAEDIKGARKFLGGCESTSGKILLAPFDYPDLLSVSSGFEVESLYHFDSHQEAKYSDLVKYDDNNYFGIPFTRKKLLHIKYNGQNGIEVKEYNINIEGFTGGFLKGVFIHDGIYCIPYHGNSVMKIFMKNNEVFLENFLLPTSSTIGCKFSDVYIPNNNNLLICVPLSFPYIMVVKPGSPPGFKFITARSEIQEPNKHKDNHWFVGPKNSSKWKFITAVRAPQNKVCFIPSSYNKFLIIQNRHFMIDSKDAGKITFGDCPGWWESKGVTGGDSGIGGSSGAGGSGKSNEFKEWEIFANEYYNYPSTRVQLFCGAHFVGKSIFAMPCTETSVIRLKMEE